MTERQVALLGSIGLLWTIHLTWAYCATWYGKRLRGRDTMETKLMKYYAFSTELAEF